MTLLDHFWQRLFDFVVSFLSLFFLLPLILLSALIAFLDTRENGFFLQTRVGQNGSYFKVIKIRTMRSSSFSSSVTVAGDLRITMSGRFFRRFKVDELPQLINVLLGHMSIVGPRPDVPGFADELQGSDRAFLLVKPGITGPASIKYKDEEYLLSRCDDPCWYNKNIIWPDKVRIGLDYIENWSLIGDFMYIVRTFR